MRLAKVIFVGMVEAPGRSDRVAYLQSTDPARKDCYAPDLWLSPLGVMASDDIYPIHLVRRMTVDAASVEADESDLRGLQAPGVPATPKRRGRPPKSKAAE